MKLDRRPIEAELMTFISDQLLEEGLHPAGDPLAADAVDSLGLEQLVEHIAAEYGVRIGGEEMIAENFESLAALAALIVSKQSGAVA